MTPEKPHLNKVINETGLEKEKSVEEYILGTLLYTPQQYVKNEKYVELKVYAPEENQPSMKLFRMINRCNPLSNTPIDSQEISFQDEVDILKNGKRDTNERWQVNFSIFVDKENYQYQSIQEKPKDISHLSESMGIFNNLAKQKGAVLYAGDWKFESNGNGWVPVNREGKEINQSELKSLMSGLPEIE